ncbi:MAG TPA: methionyl-tRNA formyltransferase [Candidatus Bathyarchaeia archaeon]|nr:methionyl-tRNA formyltransferase [Candidatus Bathyarchaeia archaeon]
MRIVFLGTPLPAVPSLEAILDAGHDVPLVVTRADKPVGRSGTPEAPAVKVKAVAAGIPVFQPARVRDAAFLSAIRQARPDALAVVAYGRILTREVLDVAKHGAINVHFSLLPRYRGAAPVTWALVRGETETGVTTFRLDEGLDTGDVLGARRVPIEPAEHAPSLLSRLSTIGAALLVETLAGLDAGTIVPRPQDPARATLAPLITRADGAWDPAWTAREVEGRVRGLDPWPGVWAVRNGKRLRVVAGRAIPGSTGSAPGDIVEHGGGLAVACASGTLFALDAVQPEGRRAVSAREAMSGRQLAPGDRLERPAA